MKKSKVIKVSCPLCKSVLWINIDKKEIIKLERNKSKRKISLEELLEQEEKKQKSLDNKMESISEIQDHKKREAEKKFEKYFSKKDKPNK